MAGRLAGREEEDDERPGPRPARARGTVDQRGIRTEGATGRGYANQSSAPWITIARRSLGRDEPYLEWISISASTRRSCSFVSHDLLPVSTHPRSQNPFGMFSLLNPKQNTKRSDPRSSTIRAEQANAGRDAGGQTGGREASSEKGGATETWLIETLSSAKRHQYARR